MVVMSPTVGITKTMAVGRLVGTFVGASVAILLYVSRSRLTHEQRLTRVDSQVFLIDRFSSPS